jgi:hypothetical protein
VVSGDWRTGVSFCSVDCIPKKHPPLIINILINRVENNRNEISPNAMSNILERKFFAETFVSPQQLPGGKSFWYRRRIDDGFEFIVVDITRRTFHSAFDHEQLAKELGKHASTCLGWN